jgi:hypothetical protein
MASGVVFNPSPWGVFTLCGEGGGIRTQAIPALYELFPPSNELFAPSNELFPPFYLGGGEAKIRDLAWWKRINTTETRSNSPEVKKIIVKISYRDVLTEKQHCIAAAPELTYVFHELWYFNLLLAIPNISLNELILIFISCYLLEIRNNKYIIFINFQYKISIS